MKKILFFLLFANFCFSQDNKLSISEIDSICSANGEYGIADGKIKIENEKNEVIGFGGSSIKTYLNYFNQEYYNKLSREEKKRYNKEKDSEIIRADYSEGISYKNSNQENIFAQFYYHKDQLFYLKLKIKKNDTVLYFSLNQIEIENEKEIKNELGLELKKWIIEKNLEILNFHNK
jgi:hypothetical protein